MGDEEREKEHDYRESFHKRVIAIIYKATGNGSGQREFTGRNRTFLG